MRYVFIYVTLLLSTPLLGQKSTISGYLKDADTGESLIGATVLHARSSSGTSANTHGFYSITLPKDSVTLLYSYVGYEPQLVRFLLRKDTVINIQLKGATVLDEVVVSATKADAIHEINRMSSISVPIDQIKALPAFLGETDVLKVLQLMPGVQSGGEGGTGLYVRGGGPDQNLLLLDGVPVYNASHLFGFFSVFNADALNHVELIKGGFPARYGGRLSSVIDIHMKDGSMKEWKGEGSVGIIASKVSVEGPIQKDRTSLLFSARRTYIDLLARPIIKLATEGQTAGYYFYDLNFKLNHIINDKNRLYLSSYTGDDKAYAKTKDFFINGNERTDYREEFGLRWGNIITAARWSHVFSPQLFANFTSTFSRYRFDIFSQYDEVRTSPTSPDEKNFYKERYVSGIRDWAMKADFDYLPNPDHYIRFGANSIVHRFAPGVYAVRSSEEADSTAGAAVTNAQEFAAYVEDDWKVNSVLKVNAGVHTSAFLVENKWYTSVQPRISSRLLLGREFSLKASYSTMTQFIHLLTNAGLGLPTDLWVPSTAKVKPQQSWQAAIGLAKTFKDTYEVSLEGYYKKMTNLIEYKDGASYFDIEKDWQDKVALNGQGWSYGTELLLQKKIGNVTGWIGYTLSWTDRQFETLNFGNRFPYKYDNRHDINVAFTHTWNERMDFSAAWVFTSGNAVTLPTAVYSGTSQLPFNHWYTPEISYYEARNAYRMKNYHRLDLSFSWWKNKKWGQRKWTLGVYNAYNRLNPFFMDIGYDRNHNKHFIQYSLFPIIPSFTYSFKF
ncbi:MAG: TonB-dependent receptor [Bacteroidota bacterium]